jgi:hypothetical protein
MPDATNPIVLSYSSPEQRPASWARDQVWATALALPGACGFCLLAGALLFESPLAWAIGPRAGLCCWVVAFFCAAFSVSLFKGRPKSPWVKCCLALNWTGIVFSLTPPGWIVFALALMVWQR